MFRGLRRKGQKAKISDKHPSVNGMLDHGISGSNRVQRHASGLYATLACLVLYCFVLFCISFVLPHASYNLN